MSLSYDGLETFRPVIAGAVMRWMEARTFRLNDFVAVEGGVVRLSAPIAREVAALTVRTVGLRMMVRMVDRLNEAVLGSAKCGSLTVK
jgi:hypothetical protein